MGPKEVGISLFLGSENEILTLGLEFTNEKTIEKWEWDLDLNKTIETGVDQNLDWEMGLSTPPSSLH